MKICQLCAVDFTLHRFLLPLILAERDAGHEVVGVCADGPLLARVRDTGLLVETAPFSRDFNLARHARAYRRLVALFRAERFDMVHVHTPIASLIGRLAAWRAGVPRIVYTAHGFYFHERMAWPKRALFIALEWLAGRVTDVVFTQAAEDAETARRHNLCPDGVIEAIGNGVDVARFAPATDGGADRRALRESLDTPDDAVVVVGVGRLVAEKGYPELFDAMRDVDAHLWVVGERLASDHARSIDDAIARAQADPSLALRLRLLGARDDVADLLRPSMAFLDQEHFRVLVLNTRNEVLAAPDVFVGSVNATTIRTAEVFREAVRQNATSIIAVHNHPSGDPEPSREDAAVTAELVAAGKALDIEVADHIVVARDGWVSLKERGLGFG